MIIPSAAFISIHRIGNPQGLFGTIDSQAEITNLGVIESWINGTVDNSLIGGIVGQNFGSVSNCYNAGTVSNNTVVGGVVCINNGTISNCYNTGTVSGNGTVGGVVGVDVYKTINCYNTGTVSGKGSVGGVVGSNLTGREITNCCNNGAVSGTATENISNNYVGGVVGIARKDVTNCYNTGTVSGKGFVGGVAGFMEVAITNCYNTGTVRGTAIATEDIPNNYVGGVVGKAGYVATNCHNTGTVSGKGFVGGVAGSSNVGITNCYYLKESAEIGIGKSEPDTPVSTEVKTGAAFASGEVAWLLQKEQPVPEGQTAPSQVWGQNLVGTPKDFLPVLTNVLEKKVVQVTLDYDEPNPDQFLYCAVNGVIILPTPEVGTIYTYTQADGTILSQTAMTTHQILSDETFTVKKYQLTENDKGVIQIGTPAALIEFSRYVNDGNTTANAVLMTNVELRDTNSWTSWSATTDPTTLENPQWIPIGTADKQYNGTFDGTSHTVSGIYINSENNSPQGLFGDTGGALIIKNLGVIKSSINGYKDAVVHGNITIGGLVGRNCGLVDNCYNTGNMSNGDNIGGVVGANQGTITNCYNTGNVGDGMGSTGGVAGDNGRYATISNCYYAEGSVGTGKAGIGGKSDAPGSTDMKSLVTFASGEVTWLLQNGQASQTTQVWGQNLVGTPADTIPLLKATDKIYCVTFKDGNGISTESKAYTNNGGKVTPPTPATGYVWKDIVTQAVFTAETAVTKDLSVQCSKSLSAVTITLSADSYVYTGAAITPVVTVTDAGTTLTPADYTVIYTNNINPGSATVTITGKGNYAGIVTKNFTITSSGGGGGGGTPPAPPAMPGVVVNPGTITFDPAGNLAVDITGAPAGSAVYYSLDGITFTTNPPAMENAGEHKVYIKVTSPGYQDYISQTIITVDKHEAPVIPEVSVPVPVGQQTGSTDLGALLPPNRGQIRYQLVSVNDPREILRGIPTIDQNGRISYGFASPLSVSGENLTASAATDSATSSATITVLVTMENYADTTIILVVSEEEAFGVQYQTHIQDIGWETDWRTDGALSGTFGQSKRLEALKVELTGDVPTGATIDTEVHVQNYGNMGPFAMGTAAGTTGKGLRLENICLTLKNLPGYTLLYDVHVQNQGWLRDENDSSTWFKSGETAGTSALSLRLEGIRIKLVKDQ